MLQENKLKRNILALRVLLGIGHLWRGGAKNRTTEFITVVSKR